MWRCDLNNKAARDKGRACNSTAVTTGTSTSSSLEYAKPHSHLPDPERIGGKKIRESTKETAKTTTEKPHKILADAYDGTPEDVQANLPTKVTLKRTIQKTRQKEALSVNPQLALANDRSLSTFRTISCSLGSTSTLVLEQMKFSF